MNIRHILSGLAFCISLSVGMASCDDHIEVEDTNMKVGHILCTDGSVIPQDQVKMLGKKPIAVVFYVNKDNGNAIQGTGLAAYLWDVDGQVFSDTIGIVQGTSSSFDAYDGNSNTYALFNNIKSQSPMAKTVFSLWHNERSCYVPSVAEMKLMYSARYVIDTCSKEFGGSSITGNEGNFYWTSTEVKGQEGAKAWVYSLSTGAIQEAPKTRAYKIRPIITIYN